MQWNIETLSGANALTIRSELGLSQKVFWNRIGFTADEGSRFETGKKELSPSAKILLTIAYSERPYRAVALLRGEWNND